MYLDLKLVKKHLNIDEEFHDDDEYLIGLTEAAEGAVEKHIDTPLDCICGKDGCLPPAVRHAILLLVANFYANRESVSFASCSKIPLSYEYLIDLYKDYSGEYGW